MDARDKGYLLLKNLMDNMSDMIYFKDADSRFIMVNKASARWQGFRHPDDAVGTSDFDRYQEEDARRMLGDERRIMDTGSPMVGIEESETLKNGQEMWVSTTKMPLRDNDGGIIGTFGISRDITRHKEAELRAARFAEEVQRIKDNMEEDLRMAAELQKTFLPRLYPVFPQGSTPEQSRVGLLHHYRPSGMVSGDFCSIRRLSDTECGVLQCDVMGHGVRAALVTALIYAMVDELSQQTDDPGEYLSRMNQLLLPTLRQEDCFLYATATYLIYNSETGRLRFANAGHPFPLLFQTLENRVSLLMQDEAARGPALAICENVEFQTLEKQLVPGDAVVLYTDGLYEAEDASGNEFGEERLLQAAGRQVGKPLNVMFTELINEVRAYSVSGEFDDDVCLVGLECRSLLEKEEE